MLTKTGKLIDEFNKVHLTFFQDYFETTKIKKINLKHTLPNVPIQHILAYRLSLNEFDYLYRADLYDIRYFYRVKNSKSTLHKTEYF